jgi:drug/metabolite transporter (DMT)-like permease
LTVTGVRFALALPVLLLLVVLKDGVGALSTYQFRDLPALGGLALLPGFVALLLYYRALRSTPASVATLAETAYPLVVTLLLALPAPYGFSQHLYPLQLVGSGLFGIAILGLNVTTPRGLVRTVPERRRGLNEAGVA